MLTLILKRRIMNELLTTYLPTCFILSIVYATTFFKPFFFEAGRKFDNLTQAKLSLK